MIGPTLNHFVSTLGFSQTKLPHAFTKHPFASVFPSWTNLQPSLAAHFTMGQMTGLGSGSNLSQIILPHKNLGQPLSRVSDDQILLQPS
jgi:hypothetical protein